MEVTYPGVYITEFGSGVRPIEGVSTSTTNLLGAAQVQRMKELVGTVGRDWTGDDDGDPGVALLELFGWLADALLRRVNQVPDAATPHAARLAAAALHLLRHSEPAKGSPIKAVRFYDRAVIVTDDASRERRNDDECVCIRRP